MTHRPSFHLPSSSSSWRADNDVVDGDAPATPTPPLPKSSTSSSAPPSSASHVSLPPLSSCGPEDGEGDDIITSHRRRRRLRLRRCEEGSCSEEGSSGRCAHGDDDAGASLTSAESSSSSSSTRRTRLSLPAFRAATRVAVTVWSACCAVAVVESFVIRPPSMMPRSSSSSRLPSSHHRWAESSSRFLPAAATTTTTVAAGSLAAGRRSGVGCRGWSSKRTRSSRLYHYAALRDDDFDFNEDDDEEEGDDGITNTFDGDEDSDDDDSANGGLDALSWLPSVHSTSTSSSTSTNTSPTFTSTSPDLFYTPSLPKLRPGAQVLPFFPLGGGGNSASLDSLGGGEPHYWPGTTGHVLSIFEPRYRRMYADLIARGGANLSKDGASKIIGRSSLGKSLGWSGLSSKEENEDEDKMRFVVSMPYPTDASSSSTTLVLDEDDLDSLGALYGDDNDNDDDEGYEYLLADDEDSIPNDSSLGDSSLNDDSLFGMGSAKEGVFARYGVLMEVTSIQDVSSETDNQIKYVATHDVIGRVKIHRVLNPDCWEDEETYLTVEATLIDDDEEKEDGGGNNSGAGRGSDEGTASKGMDVLTAVKQLLDEGIIDAVSATSRTPPEFTSDELKLHATFANLVQLQHSLNTDVKFTTSSVHTFGKGTGGGSKGLWKTIDAWFQYVHQSLIARQAVMQKDFQERLLQFLKDNNKLNDKKEDRSGAGSFGSGDVGNLFKDDDEEEESLDDDEDEDGDDLPTAIDYNDLPPDLQREVHDVQVRTSAELGPIELERTVDAQRFLEVPTHTDRVKLLCSLVDRERRRLETVKMLRGMFDGGGSGGDDGEGSAMSDDASASSADVKSTLDPNSEAATMNRFRSSLERLVVDSSSSTPSSSSSTIESKRKKGDDSFTEGADDDDDATYHDGESSDVDDDEGGREDGLPPPPSSSSMSSSRRIDGISGYGSSSSGNKTGGGLGSGGVASIFLDGNDLDAFQ